LVARALIAGGPGGCSRGALGGDGGSTGTGTVVTGAAGNGSSTGGAGGGAAPGIAGSVGPGVGGDIGPPPGGRGGAAGAAGIMGAAGQGGRGGIGGFGGFVSTGGQSGRGGVGGEFGTAGTGQVYCPPAAPVCGAALCGNGKVDTCVPVQPPACQRLMTAEGCDGSDFGGESCLTHHFSSGNLSCGSDCTVDASGCSECVPGPSVIRCGLAPFAALPVSAFGLAATDNEVALATINYDMSGTQSLTFTRMTPDLNGVSVTFVDDPPQPGPLLQGTAVAPLASGWVVAICGPGIYIHTFDANGVDKGRAVVAAGPTDGYGCAYPVTAAGPGGQVLLAWLDDLGVHATVIAADGRSFSPPQTIVASPLAVPSDLPTAAWIADAFYVAASVSPPPNFDVVDLRIMRVAADGQVSIFGDNFPGFYGGASLASGASDLRVVYGGAPPQGGAPGDSNVLWQRIGPDDHELGAVSLATNPPYYGRSLAVAFGDTTVVLVGGYSGQALGLTRLALDGQVLTPVHDVIAGPDYWMQWWDMARRGPDVIVGWLRQDQQSLVGLARLSP
jgi:hypothetical protein